MKPTTKQLVNAYVNFSGYKDYMDFAALHLKVVEALEKEKPGTLDHHCLSFVSRKLARGLRILSRVKKPVQVRIHDSLQDIIDDYKPLGKMPLSGNRKRRKAKRPAKRKAPRKSPRKVKSRKRRQ